MVRPERREGSWQLGRIAKQILPSILPLILNCCPTSRDSQLLSRREGIPRISLGQIHNFDQIWPRLVYPQPCAITALLLRLNKESALMLDTSVGGSFTHKTAEEGEALLDCILENTPP